MLQGILRSCIQTGWTPLPATALQRTRQPAPPGKVASSVLRASQRGLHSGMAFCPPAAVPGAFLHLCCSETISEYCLSISKISVMSGR